MTERIEITRMTGDLCREVWRFYFSDVTLYVDLYALERRQSRRHGWKRSPDVTYSRIDGSRSYRAKMSRPPLPDDVAAQAKAELVELITVKIWEAK